MDEEALMAKAAKSWKLAQTIADNTQGFVPTGFSTLPFGVALFLELPEHCGGDWLKALQAEVPVTAAGDVGGAPGLDQAASIAFTWTGLQRMRLPETALASFAAPFREGMFQEDRLRRLGDRRSGEWLDTVTLNGPNWSGNTPSIQRSERIGAYSVGTADPAQPILTPTSVHALLLIYTKTAALADQASKTTEAILERHKVGIVRRLPLLLDIEEKGFSREHFGFADGLSQPKPFDEGGAVKLDGEDVVKPDLIHGVPLGEFMIGYKNGHQERAPGPVVPGEFDGGEKDPRPCNAGLSPHPEAQGFFDIGENGSYLIVRELRQDVSAFWRSMEEAATVIQQHDKEAKHVDSDWLAAKVVGRTTEGHVLRPEGPLGPSTENAAPANDFLFYDADQLGFGCPLGSHVRRANPRDALASKPEDKSTLLDAANNHRILRRGRKYGPKLQDRTKDDGEDRGLLFMCLNTDIARQFEFIQQTWLLNTDFATLFEEVDPLVGADGGMTIPEDPLRRRVNVQTFVQMAGGEYFFLPSMPALQYLTLL